MLTILGLDVDLFGDPGGVYGTRATSQDDPIVTIGEHELLPDTPGQPVEILVSGGQPVVGLDFFLEVADGGPAQGGSIEGPTIEDIDLVDGTIFAANHNLPVDPEPQPDQAPQTEARLITTGSGSVAAAGLLATVYIDTSDFSAGSWSLNMVDTTIGDSSFPGVEAQFLVGSITIVDPNGPQDGHLSIPGSAAGDVFEFIDEGAIYRIRYNGAEYQYAAAAVDSVEFDGGGGHDIVQLAGGDLDDTVDMWLDSARLVNSGVQVDVVDVDDITASGGLGSDRVNLYDSTEDDIFDAWPYGGRMTGDGKTNTADDFDVVAAQANSGGFDQARLSDSAGNETYVGAGDYGGLWGDDFEVHVLYFDDIRMTASEGRDVAKFYDTAADDVFTGTPTEAAMSVVGGYYNAAIGFDQAHAYGTAGTGYDTANLYGFAGDDIFYGHPIESALYTESGEFFNRAKLFEEVNATAGAGGYDLARMYDSVADDVFVSAPEYGELSGMRHDEFTMQLTDRPYKYKAMKFSGVHAYATHGGYDRAKMFDSNYDDIFYAEPEHAALYTLDAVGAYYNRAKFFERVDAYANGGNDVAYFVDSYADDIFYADQQEAAMYSTAYQGQYNTGYYNRGKDFERAEAYSSNGGNDKAYLDDSPLDDYLVAEANWAELSNAQLGFARWVTDFAEVTATSSNQGDTKNVDAAVDWLITLGYWQDE